MENLDRMEKFFKYDIEIKNILYKSAPKEEYRYDRDSKIEYSNLLFTSINDIDFYLKNIVNNFDFSQDDKKYVKDFIQSIKVELIKCGFDYNKLEKFYNICFSDMREELVNEVANNCYGYGGMGVSLSRAKSINELLHVIHQTIINNENNYESLPIIDERKEDGITLYGKENEIARSIFKAFPSDLISTFINIMSLSNDKVVIMVRDYGYALVIELDKEKDSDKYYVRYFIPKICNVDMVNALKGVNKVDKNSRYTVGIFETSLDKLPFEIVDFVRKVPTDDDLEIIQKYNRTK